MCKKTTMEYRETNKVHLKGKIAKSLTFSHEFFGEKFLETSLLCERMSGVVDILPIIFPERIGNLDLVQPDTCIDIQGRIKTYNKKEEGSIRNKLIINVYCDEFTILPEEDFYPSDHVELDAYICKEPIYRSTPKGREIADLLLAVNRGFGKSDYIPGIAWSRNARYVSELPVGSNIQVSGRLQSREYVKRVADGTEMTKMAYELSINRIVLIKEADNVSNEEDAFHEDESEEVAVSYDDMEHPCAEPAAASADPIDDYADDTSETRVELGESSTSFMPTDIDDFGEELPFI